MSNNPYQTPAGQLQTDDDQAFGEVSFFNPAGRLNRLRYWAHGMLFAIGFYIAIAVGFLLAFSVSPFIGYPIIAIAYITLIVFSFIVMIQRLHDLDKSGWMCLLALIPLVNIYLIVLLIFFKGTPGRNRFGLQTPPNKTWHWIAGLAVPVFAVAIMGILAAIAIPQYQRYVERAQEAQEQSYEHEQTEGDSYYTDDEQTESDTSGEYYDNSESESVDGSTEEMVEDSTEESTEENSEQ
jgi:uncharacterized membrane protein YhaH (DUF805 family)